MSTQISPQEFATKWRQLAPQLSERAAYQEHWRDLCTLLGEPTPTSDLSGHHYAFEKHVKKAGTGETGFADVFHRDHFIVEYKARGKSLGKALQQALLYARELGNPPLLVVSDLEALEIHTNFTGSTPRTIRMGLDDIARDTPVGGDLTALSALRAMFHEPEKLHPRRLRERVTQEATAKVGDVAQALVARGVPQVQAAHFLMRVVFAMFAEDVGLLEKGLLTRVLEAARLYPTESHRLFADLFGAMRTGGFFGATPIRHFNGGLFNDAFALALLPDEVDALLVAARLDWSEVEPAIFGTLFENSLDAQTRSKRGSHYTSARDILRITEPVIMQPLRREWASVKEQTEALVKKRGGKKLAVEVLKSFQQELSEVRVLDPACGSGNFLVVALGQLLDLEQEVRALGAELGAGPFAMPPRVHPRQMLGIEVEAFAQELASVSIWIAFFQWKAAHGGEWTTPVLQTLNNIEHRDALLNPDGTEAHWPAAEFIIGNPPFLGEKKQGPRLGLPYVEGLRAAYAGRVPKTSDLVCYWFEKARTAIQQGTTRRAGLITTNSINMLGNRRVLESINETGALFRAWPNLPWLQDGAAVRVAAIAFDDGSEQERAVGHLLHEGQEGEEALLTPVAAIHPNLSVGTNVAEAKKLPENANLCFQGVKLAGDFDITEALARAWMTLPNPGDVDNSDVLRPLLNGDDLTSRRSDTWVIDFASMTEGEASQYLVPFAHVVEKVKPVRATNNRKSRRERYWQLGEVMPAMRRALKPLPRYLATSIVAKYRTFLWCDAKDLPSGALAVVASDQDWMYGMLNSCIHVAWALHSGTTLEDRPRYTATSCFETFPFPEWTPEAQQAVAEAAKFLEKARAGLKAQGLTITEMYNALSEATGTDSPAYTLKLAHARLDQAVADAYGWTWPLTEDEVLGRLLTLNQERTTEKL